MMTPTLVVTPAEAGVQKTLKNLDSGFRRNDGSGFRISTGRLNTKVWDQ